MSLNETPSGERVHIGFFGRRNAGKSSLVNAITGQDMSVVSDVQGTTTDPVRKSMELLPMGPVLITDTPGFDDEGQLGELRVKKTRQELGRTDVAVLVVDSSAGLAPCDEQLISLFKEKDIPYIIAWNKSDLLQDDGAKLPANEIHVSAVAGTNIDELKDLIAGLSSDSPPQRLVSDLISAGDTVVLVMPIDASAPKGRIILPQQQVLRDVLDSNAIAICVQESELEETLAGLKDDPAMVITDSQVFKQVADVLPERIPLTSFSILLARYKGFLDSAVAGVKAVDSLKEGDTVLISEGCTHHRQCEDIGTVKIPNWLRKYTGKEINIETSSGAGFPDDLSRYALVIHCGACMLGEREVISRMKKAAGEGVPFTNYGICIAYMQGILKRCVEPFPHLSKLL